MSTLDAHITREDGFYIGDDKVLEVTVYTSLALTTIANVTGAALSWKLADRPGGTVVLTKTTASGIAISGTFNADPDVNTQVVEITIADTDTDGLEGKTWWHELRRTDAGQEGVICQGRCVIQRAIHTA